MKTSVNFTGHAVLDQGIPVDPQKTYLVAVWPTPKFVRDVCVFVGLCGYYHKLMKDFVPIESCESMEVLLHALTAKNAKYIWTKDHQDAFETLKQKVITSPTLAMPDDQSTLVLDTDASDTSIGAVLSQLQQDK